MELKKVGHNNRNPAADLGELRSDGGPLITIMATMLRSALNWEMEHDNLTKARENAKESGNNERE